MDTASENRFNNVFSRHRDDVSRYCLRRLAVEDAREAVTEVFLVAWRKIDDIPDSNDALPWLYGVAGNVVRNRTRSVRRSLRLAARLRREPGSAGSDPAAQVVRQEADREVVAALATLSHADQEVLRLRAYEELSFKQISLVLGCSVEAAKKRSSRALKRLRTAVDLLDPAAKVPTPRAMTARRERDDR